MEVGDEIMDFMNPDINRAVSPVSSWPLARFDHAIGVLVAYVAFVLLAPLFVKMIFKAPAAVEKKVKLTVAQKISSEPFLMPLMVMYNATQVFLCGYMIKGAYDHYQKAGYKFICNKFDETESGMAAVLWVFYVSKVLDFCDTFFIVARQKWVQLSFLHTYHHATIFIFYWLNLNVAYDGDIYYTIILNAAIHFVMYFYYFLTTFNIYVPQFIKKMITQAQMFQFVTMNAQAIYLLANGCPFPQRVTFAYLFYIISLFFLFNNFKNRTYKKTDKKEDKKKDKKDK